MKQPANILIVDDNIGLAKTMALILRRKGYLVATAKDGPEAIQRVEDAPVDLVFMDIKMPLMDGVEACRQIKEVRPDAVVVMMTAYAVEDLIQQALEEGAYGIVYKPLDIEKVVQVIGDALQARKGALVLVVDDDPATCGTLRSVLVSRGHQVGIAHSGEAALAMAREAVHDIVFVEVRLPTINGLETYLAIKEINPQAVAVMMAAYWQEMASLVDEALRNHAYTCLYKPLAMDRLPALIEEILIGKRDATSDRTRGR